MNISRVGIVGCGVMGSGIGQLCAEKKMSVIICDADEGALKDGMNKMRSRLASRDNRDDILSRISSTTDISAFNACDLVIEAVTEKLDLKKTIFEQLDHVCPEHTIFATNTSVLPVVEMARATQRPNQVVGTHFLTPPQVNPLLEIIKTLLVDEPTMTTMVSFGRYLGKRVVISKDHPGFIVNRILTAILLNAVRLLEEGVGTMEDIEAAVKTGLGLPMGPFALMDLIGLDTIRLGTTEMFKELNDPQYACPVEINRMVSAGLLGQKSGKGFYEYPTK